MYVCMYEYLNVGIILGALGGLGRVACLGTKLKPHPTPPPSASSLSTTEASLQPMKR